MKSFTRISYLVNDNSAPVTPGTILLRDNARANNFTIIGNVFELTNSAPPDRIITNGQPHDRYHLTQNNVEFNFNVGVGNVIYKNKAGIYFSGKNSALIVYKQGVTQVLQWGIIHGLLSELWEKNKYTSNFRNYFLVTSVLETPEAIVLYSRSNNTSVRLESSNNLPLANISSLINIDTGLLSATKTVGYIEVKQNSPLLLETIRWDRTRKSFTPFIP